MHLLPTALILLLLALAACQEEEPTMPTPPSPAADEPVGSGPVRPKGGQLPLDFRHDLVRDAEGHWALDLHVRPRADLDGITFRVSRIEHAELLAGEREWTETAWTAGEERSRSFRVAAAEPVGNDPMPFVAILAQGETAAGPRHSVHVVHLSADPPPVPDTGHAVEAEDPELWDGKRRPPAPAEPSERLAPMGEARPAP